MKTKKQVVTGNVSIWALPLTRYEIEHIEAGKEPWEYRLYTDTQPWQSGAVKVVTHEVKLAVPTGIDLCAKAIETLEEALEERKKQYQQEVADIKAQIDQFKLLTYQPEEANGQDIDLV